MKLRSLCSEAVATLQGIMGDSKSPAHVRAGIAFKILELVLQERVAPLPAVRVQPTINAQTLQLIREEVYGLVDPPHSGLSDTAAATLRAKFLGLED